MRGGFFGSLVMSYAMHALFRRMPARPLESTLCGHVAVARPIAMHERIDDPRIRLHSGGPRSAIGRLAARCGRSRKMTFMRTMGLWTVVSICALAITGCAHHENDQPTQTTGASVDPNLNGSSNGSSNGTNGSGTGTNNGTGAGGSTGNGGTTGMGAGSTWVRAAV